MTDDLDHDCCPYDEMPQQDDSAKRARVAYDAFRSGFDHDGAMPHWDDAPSWVRDVVLVAYLQGKLDRAPDKPETGTEWLSHTLYP